MTQATYDRRRIDAGHNADNVLELARLRGAIAMRLRQHRRHQQMARSGWLDTFSLTPAQTRRIVLELVADLRALEHRIAKLAHQWRVGRTNAEWNAAGVAFDRAKVGAFLEAA